MPKKTKPTAEALSYERPEAWKRYTGTKNKRVQEYAAGYAAYLDASKTEREAVKASIALAEKCGFKPYEFGQKVKAGDRLYYNSRGKNLYLFRIGTEPLENGIRISAAHIDSPRLDIKQIPLYEDGGLGFLKTHYYGGIKKYQWTTVPLALHGVISLKDGTNVEIDLGEKDGDPVFCVTDLLIHLSHAQMEKSAATVIPGENLNVLLGSLPDENEEKTPVKMALLRLLNERYGITEADFLSAELSAVPAQKARDLGLDRSMIAAYGHDDRVCAYPALTALLDCKSDTHTLMCVLADKEETGSNGVSGMQSMVFTDLIESISTAMKADIHRVRANSLCLSADVVVAFDPNYPDVYEKANSALMNHGVTIMKYSGSRGKYGTSDASAELVAKIRAILDGHDVPWQTAELGKVDEGGGGTVAVYIAQRNIPTIDLGVPVISMHAPVEVIAKMDLYSCYEAIAAFCE